MERSTFYSGDPVARFLIERLRLTPIHLAVLLTVGVFCWYFLAALLSNTLVSRPGQIGFLNSWTTWLWILFFVPVLGGYYLWVSNQMHSLIQALKYSQVVDISDDEMSIILAPYQKPWRKLLSVLGGMIFGTIFFVSRSNITNNWSSSGLIPQLSSTLSVMIGGYMTSVIALTLIMNVWALGKALSSKKFRLNPLHPDHCGGLSPLSRYSLMTAYLAVIAGAFIGIIQYILLAQNLAQEYWYIFLSTPLYLIWALTSFFAPLTTAHVQMQEAKREKLSEIANQFREEYAVTLTELHKNSDDLKQGMEKIKLLQELYEVTQKFPDWPFDAVTLRSFLVALTTPIAAPIITILVQVLADRLTP